MTLQNDEACARPRDPSSHDGSTHETPNPCTEEICMPVLKYQRKECNDALIYQVRRPAHVTAVRTGDDITEQVKDLALVDHRAMVTSLARVSSRHRPVIRMSHRPSELLLGDDLVGMSVSSDLFALRNQRSSRCGTPGRQTVLCRPNGRTKPSNTRRPWDGRGATTSLNSDTSNLRK